MEMFKHQAMFLMQVFAQRKPPAKHEVLASHFLFMSNLVSYDTVQYYMIA